MTETSFPEGAVLSWLDQRVIAATGQTVSPRKANNAMKPVARQIIFAIPYLLILSKSQEILRIAGPMEFLLDFNLYKELIRISSYRMNSYSHLIRPFKS